MTLAAAAEQDAVDGGFPLFFSFLAIAAALKYNLVNYTIF